jgi:hypothetical protein
MWIAITYMCPVECCVPSTVENTVPDTCYSLYSDSNLVGYYCTWTAITYMCPVECCVPSPVENTVPDILSIVTLVGYYVDCDNMYVYACVYVCLCLGSRGCCVPGIGHCTDCRDYRECRDYWDCTDCTTHSLVREHILW